jgi:hypothetical protein
VRAFTRLAVEDYDADRTTIPAGDRVLVIFASANRDERRYADPDRFDISRDARDHLGFGHGVHRCAGGYLAELEMQSLLRAMVARVRHIEVGEPTVALSNVLRGYRSFRASFRGVVPCSPSSTPPHRATTDSRADMRDGRGSHPRSSTCRRGRMQRAACTLGAVSSGAHGRVSR